MTIREIIVKHTSEMLDHPYGNGLYPTSKFYDNLEADFASLVRREKMQLLKFLLDNADGHVIHREIVQEEYDELWLDEQGRTVK